MKGLRAGVWRTKDINISGKNSTDISFANIGNQILFLDTVKYFQQSLGALANSLTDQKKSAISRECKKIVKNDPKLVKKYLSCTEEEQKWILNYLSTRKRTILYEMITKYHSLYIAPENGQFFLPQKFYSSLKDNVVTDEEYENVKKFYQTMKLENLGELNKIDNFQDTIMLCEIFEQLCSHLQDLFKFNHRKCNSASSFSGCVHRNKSKCRIALPTEAEHVRVFEKTLNGGFSCVNTRLAFDTETLLDNKNEKVIFDLYIDGKKQTKRISTKILKGAEVTCVKIATEIKKKCSRLKSNVQF